MASFKESLTGVEIDMAEYAIMCISITTSINIPRVWNRCLA